MKKICSIFNCLFHTRQNLKAFVVSPKIIRANPIMDYTNALDQFLLLSVNQRFGANLKKRVF